jgi:tetratricopeptide (TPR) repeat protein
VVEAGQRRHTEALASFDRALAVRPDYAEALYNRGVTLQELKRFDEALASYDRALAVRPNYAEALHNRGNVLKEMIQATNPRGGKQVEATLKARFSTRLGVSNIAMTSNSLAPSAPLLEQNQVAKRVQDELVQRVQDTQSSLTRMLELSKQLNEVLSRPLPWI